MCELWFPHWRGIVPDQVFRRRILHQLQPQRDLRLRGAHDDAAVCPAESGAGAFSYLQRERPETRPGPRRLLRSGSNRAAELGGSASSVFLVILERSEMFRCEKHPRGVEGPYERISPRRPERTQGFSTSLGITGMLRSSSSPKSWSFKTIAPRGHCG